MPARRGVARRAAHEAAHDGDDRCERLPRDHAQPGSASEQLERCARQGSRKSCSEGSREVFRVTSSLSGGEDGDAGGSSDAASAEQKYTSERATPE